MKRKGEALLLSAFFVLLTPLVFLTGDAGAATYHGDGAVPNSTGGWAEPSARTFFSCLDCHGVRGDVTCRYAWCKKGGYLMTGHKNVLRRVSPGSPWAGADGSVYPTLDPYGSGSIFDWSSGTVLAGGAQPPRALFYIFGGWMSPDALNTIFEGGFTGELFSGGSYECARCHTTGYRFDATGPLPVQTDSQISRIPTGGSSNTSSWYLDGVQCERCHRDAANDAGGHACYAPDGTHLPQYDGNYMSCVYGSGFVNSMRVAKPTFENATALCIECHRQESVDAGNNIVLRSGLEVSNGGPSYAPFFDGSTGQAFLNSPHARFAGSLSQKVQNSPDLTVTLTGAYTSQFKNLTLGPDFGKNLGCTGCHDVHQSAVEAVNASAPLKKQCSDCHTEGQTLGFMNHRSGAGTPLGDLSDVSGACKICHMPNGHHLFRISSDAGYRTFPTEAAFNLGQRTANTASDGTFSEAVWIDVDLACGQCHGGGTNPANNPPRYPILWLSREALAERANGIHNNTPDLVISALTVPSVATPGGVISVTDSTKNRGGGPAGASTTAFSLSNNAACGDGDDVLLSGARSVGSLAANQTSTGTASVTIPAGTAPGIYYICAKADNGGMVAEVDEGNNARASEAISVVASNVDLVILSIYAPASAKKGASISITDATKNRLTETAGASTTSVYLSANTTWDAGDVLLGSRVVGALAGGASSPATYSVTIPAGTTAGIYYIIWKADSAGVVGETDETNNTKYKAITITN